MTATPPTSSPNPIVEVIPGTLFWGPEDASHDKLDKLQALDLCRHGAPDGGCAGTYHIKHYLKSSWGLAFGPLGLDSLLRFCRGLEVQLQAAKAQVLTTPEGDEKYRANAAVLLGAYLVLRHGWSSQDITSSLGMAEAGARFPCSWSIVDCPSKRVMSVRDCWEGVELAAKHGWINPACLLDDVEMHKACNAYNCQATQYDTAWIIPGLLMVGADPTTVILDPDPATCSQLFPKAPKGAEEPESEAGNLTWPSTSTASTEAGEPFKCGAGSSDFVSFLGESGIGMVVRANPDGEPGLPGGRSYGDRAFLPYGLRQTQLHVEDQKTPMPRTLVRLLGACEDFMHGRGDDSIMIHCRAGFGRSVTLACCLAIARLDVPGRALLGWSRIARPGAVNSRMQELFLLRMKGRSDLLSFAAPRQPLPGGKSCAAGCQVQ